MATINSTNKNGKTSSNKASEQLGKPKTGSWTVKGGLAQMLKGGVIMDVTNAEQAKIAEDAGACAVMALERIPADIREDGGIARMSDPELIKEIQTSVNIPVMAKCRIGDFSEANILEALEVDFIDESEVLTPADEEFHIDKNGLGKSAFKWFYMYLKSINGRADRLEKLKRVLDDMNIPFEEGDWQTIDRDCERNKPY